MRQLGTRILKTLFSIVVFGSSFLYVTVIPGTEIASSILNETSKYNAIPYLDNQTEEIALSDIDIDNKKTLKKYTGTITAYGPDCYGCSGITASGYEVAKNINGSITSTTLTYEDDEYGTVRVLAADPSGFPYGTIIRITGSRIDGYILGIVLDTGGAMRNAWADGNVLMDLLFASESGKDVYDFGRQKNVTFEVLRYAF